MMSALGPTLPRPLPPGSVRRRHAMALLLVLFAVFGVPRAVHAELRPDWTPKRTWVFVVGLLQWQHADIYPSFPEARKDRRDEQLVRFFRTAGVPSAQITYLQDAAATKHRIETEFIKLLDQTNEGDLLILYFCGHGSRDLRTGQTWFASYDAGKAWNSAWGVRGIFSAIEEHFSGNRALLLADCCHSGALYDEARRRANSQIAFAAITSAYSHNTSTGAWTFSDSVLAGLRGDGAVDFDGDSVIELNELARYAELEMAFVEQQRSMFFAADRFPRQAKLAARAAGNPYANLHLEALYGGRWYKVRVLEARGNERRVHYLGYDDTWDEWLGPERLRPYRPKEHAAGSHVLVRWANDGQWYPATILQAWYGLHLVHYEGYGATWDEWVAADAIKPRP
ncbi:MAG TPA: Tudor-knot domain-containing protein [Pirellulales bacterium]|jgi:hypothetical protein|nr:Tudor-knot domain-containing protein [Pirellulales bacterium]